MNKDKTVLITGAGIGIGEATALGFAKKDYHVIVTDVLEEEGHSTVTTIKDAGGSAEFLYLDVSRTEIVNQVFKEVENKYGSLSCLVNNAGVAHRQPLPGLSDEQWDNTINIDLKGMMRTARAAFPLLGKSGLGSIICLSSIAGASVGWAEHVPYTAAKGGITGLVKGLAIELAAQGIRVNAIAPGLIRTAQSMSEEHSVGPEGLAAMESSVPLGRIGVPDDIANVIIFLASEQASYITGQTITVDGGLTVAL
jgi:3-oxoacyl-[acyl-carrier protein] reductase